MPRVNRREIIADDEIQVFHAVNRCVRRTHLCGKDRRTGKDFSHRKEWARKRLEFLAGIFAIEILSYAVMSNHLHVVIRTRPDVAKSWSDHDIARRWWTLFPKRKNRDKSAAEPLPEELLHITNSPNGIREKRRRFSNLSWFMKCLCEPIAKQANAEDDVRGHFWESRYKAQPLLDEMAIAACMAYVDLNPVRANLANTPEASDFTSVQARIHDRCQAQNPSAGDPPSQPPANASQADWLVPIELTSKRAESPETQPLRRASNKGCLPMSLDKYLQLLDWTGRQFRHDKPGAISGDLKPILERLDCTTEAWLDLVTNFRRRFRTEAGKPDSLKSVSAQRRKCRIGNHSPG